VGVKLLGPVNSVLGIPMDKTGEYYNRLALFSIGQPLTVIPQLVSSLCGPNSLEHLTEAKNRTPAGAQYAFCGDTCMHWLGGQGCCSFLLFEVVLTANQRPLAKTVKNHIQHT